MDDTPLPAPTLAEIERALDKVVTALVAYRLTPTPPAGPEEASDGRAVWPVIWAGQLLATDRAVLKALDLVEGPVTQGLKHSIRELGKLVHQIVGDDGMLEVAERVCDLDRDNWGRRMSPIDSAWSGIGSWVS